MCGHKKIIATVYLEDTPNPQLGYRIRCLDCDEVLFKNKDKQALFNYLENNKHNFDLLDDFIGDNLNEKLGIA